MNSSNRANQNQGVIIALAGILQAAYLADQIACAGKCPAESYNPTLQSLFQFDAQSPEAVYGGVYGVNMGLHLLIDILQGRQPEKYRSTIRYAMGMLYLQKKLKQRQDLLEIIHSRLEHIQFKSDHFSNDINEISSSVAAVYKDTLSTFKFRIQINGNAQQLQNIDNANKIRTLLLAGIRASVMWRQMGGNRWQLFFGRKRLIKQASLLLKH